MQAAGSESEFGFRVQLRSWPVTGQIRLILLLGLTLIAGGIGHLFGVTRLYWTSGVPDMNRTLLDLWVGQAQLAGGAFYVAAARAAGRGREWRTLATAGAVVVLGWTTLAVPILFMRAPLTFRIPASVYLVLSLWILVAVVRSRRASATTDRLPAGRTELS